MVVARGVRLRHRIEQESPLSIKQGQVPSHLLRGIPHQLFLRLCIATDTENAPTHVIVGVVVVVVPSQESADDCLLNNCVKTSDVLLVLRLDSFLSGNHGNVAAEVAIASVGIVCIQDLKRDHLVRPPTALETG